jgi:hypothetical protein
VIQDTIADLQRKLSATPASADPRGRVDLLLQLGLQKRGVERWDEIWAVASEAKELAESIGYTAGIAGGLGLQAFALYVHSDYEQALTYAMKALALAQGATPMARERFGPCSASSSGASVTSMKRCAIATAAASSFENPATESEKAVVHTSRCPELFTRDLSGLYQRCHPYGGRGEAPFK